jgi:hypothetical protein
MKSFEEFLSERKVVKGIRGYRFCQKALFKLQGEISQFTLNGIFY